MKFQANITLDGVESIEDISLQLIEIIRIFENAAVFSEDANPLAILAEKDKPIPIRKKCIRFGSITLTRL